MHWTCEFVRHLVRCDGNVTVAAELCGVTARAAYKRRRHDAAFAAAWREADRRVHQLRGTARHRRAALLAAMLDGGVVPGCVNEARYTLRVWTAVDASEEQTG